MKKGKTVNWQTAFLIIYSLLRHTTRQKFNTLFSSCPQVVISKMDMYLLSYNVLKMILVGPRSISRVQ